MQSPCAKRSLIKSGLASAIPSSANLRRPTPKDAFHGRREMQEVAEGGVFAIVKRPPLHSPKAPNRVALCERTCQAGVPRQTKLPALRKPRPVSPSVAAVAL